jgi:hypothetical protein
VSFPDYGFFVSTDSGGDVVILEGRLVQRELTPTQAQHLTGDMNASASLRPGLGYAIVADVVRVFKS